MPVYHAIERTSPKGPGSKFIGTCRLCGTPNLPASAARQECPNQRGLTTHEAIIEVVGTMRWDEWRGSMDGRPTLWVRRLWHWRGRLIDIHKMVAKDDADCFHTHPAYAVRLILWGGYVEEMEDGSHRMWRPGMIGIVKPHLCHRVAGLRNGRGSYSLWIRFRKRAPVHMRGNGWRNQQQTFRAKDTMVSQP